MANISGMCKKTQTGQKQAWKRDDSKEKLSEAQVQTKTNRINTAGDIAEPYGEG